MKIAVYTICKDENKHIRRWYDSCKDADEVLIVDTGSTDGSQSTAFELHIPFYNITLKPWRFDDARNFALNLISPDVDVCIALDMDEVLVEGWRDIVEKSWTENVDRLRYNYIWSWSDDGSPGLTYYGDKIHARHGFRWVNPVHEVLIKDKRLPEESQVFIKNTLILHYPDDNKSRSDYLDLLSLAVKEDPLNDRNAHYYARDLLFAKRYDEAIVEFRRHLDLPTATWKSERAASMRYLGDCFWAKSDIVSAMYWFNRACDEAPGEREPLISLAQAYRALGQWGSCVRVCEKALKITERPNSYINQPWAWGSWPHEMLEEARRNA